MATPPYPGQQPQPGQRPYPVQATAPRGRWGTGPKVLTWLGAALLLVSVVAGVLGVVVFANAVPTGIITGQGEPGENTIGSGEVPGSTTVQASTGDVIVIWEVTANHSSAGVFAQDVRVTNAAGEVVVTIASVTGSSAQGTKAARTVAQFVAGTSGSYTVEVGGGGVDTTGFVVTKETSISGFVGSVFGVIALWTTAIGAFVIGLGLLIGGIAWGSHRRRRPSWDVPPGWSGQQPGPPPGWQQGPGPGAGY